MALVSYVDILEVVGELKDFKVKLVEGEGIANRGGIKEIRVNERGPGVSDISALCESNVEDQIPYSISISVVEEPRLLHCECSCLDGKSGKCQHVVATLIHIHRNNITIEGLRGSKEEKVRKPQVADLTCSSNAFLGEEFSTNTCPSSLVSLSDNSVSRVPTNLEDRKFQDEKSNILSGATQPVTKAEEVISMETNMDAELVEDIVTLEKSMNPCNEDGTPMDVDPNLVQRMGRGHRKSVPNPKYTNGVKLKCHLCGCSFKNQSQLDSHVLSHTSDGDLKCLDCSKLFTNLKELEVHKQVHGPAISNSTKSNQNRAQNEFMCDICGKGFQKLAQLTVHKHTHTDDKPFKCTQCPKQFGRLSAFKAHKHDKADSSSSESTATATASRKRTIIKCETCGKEFTNRVHHEEHVRSHTGERPFQCVECGKGFATKRSLRNHNHLGKNARERPHMCSQCPATFTTGFMLKIHEKGHSGEKPFACDECGKAYRSQHVYQDHLNQHKGIKAHKCKECGKCFTWRTSLWAHTKEHSKEKPFECVQCGAKFAEQTELKDHWEVHFDDKPFQCPECGIGFMLEADCEKHLEIHKMSPSYCCTKCDEKFVWAEELNRHMYSHKEKKRCLCPTCGQTFSNCGERFVMCEALRKHKKSIHLLGADVVRQSSSEEESALDLISKEKKKDPLNRLIEDSQILVEEESDTSCDNVNQADSAVLPEGYEIVQVNLVDSSELEKLPEGYRCETVEVYHAESLAGFEESGEFQAVSITSIPSDIGATPVNLSCRIAVKRKTSL
ncbi:hypothetical protein FOCC_FOCC013309 [Frankliniella occidentalis]|nr:hypothetical protein FOCC_FOCC013309 [Frankliniella occidentalis]